MLENQNPASENPTSPQESQESKPNLDVDRWNGVKDKTLEKFGFPKHALKHTKVIAVFGVDGEGVGDPDLCLIYNETGRLEDMLGYEPFKRHDEFDEACRKTAGYYKEAHESRLRGLERAIKDYQEKIKRVWTHKPQEQEGTYLFDGKGFITAGIQEGLKPEEIQLILANIQKRKLEKALEIKNRALDVVGLTTFKCLKVTTGQRFSP